MKKQNSGPHNLCLILLIVSAACLAQAGGVVPTKAFKGQAKAKGVLRPADMGFTVNSTADTPDANPGDCVCADANGGCTLRAAITEANACSGADTIDFNIGSGTPTIVINSTGNGPLPKISETVTINGNTGGATRVELNGAAVDGDGLIISADSSTITFLVINRFNGNGILISGGGHNRIGDSYIGTDSSGSVDQGNKLDGVAISNSTLNSIEGSVISGNDGNGVFIVGESSTMNTLLNSFVGTNATGTGPLGNTGAGVLIQSPQNDISNNTIGANSDGVVFSTGSGLNNTVRLSFIGTNSAGANLGNVNRGVMIGNSASRNGVNSNTIAFNGTAGSATSGAGVSVESGTGNSIRSNSIHDNLGLGIDLLPAGVTPNDNCDTDAGTNNLQNSPNLLTATSNGTTTFISGSINSTSFFRTYGIDFFSNETCDPSLNGEGQVYLGSTPVMTQVSCDASFTVALAHPSPIGSFITATATNLSSGDTSEFSICLVVVAPTAVEFAGMSASRYDGGTLLEWRTGFEVSNLGFNLYREVNGKRSRLNRSIVAGSALLTGPATALTAGHSYKWVDDSAQLTSGATYWLEDIDLSGSRSWHGPFSAQPVPAKLPELAASLTLHSLHSELATHPADALTSQPVFSLSNRSSSPASTAASATPLGARSSDDRLNSQWELASSPAVKISIRKQGWYRVDQAQLLAAGLSPDADPTRLQLFADGQQLPMIVSSANKGRIASGDSVEFYATGFDTPSTDARIYWLVAGTQPGKRFKAAQIAGANPSTASSFAMSVELKERSVYYSALKNGEGENFFGPVVTKEGAAQTITIRNLDPQAEGEATLEVALQGVTDLPDVETDHLVSVSLNGTEVGSLSFAGRTHKSAKLVIPHKSLREGDNLVSLASQGETDISLLDYLRLTYRHTYRADDDALLLTAEGGESIKVGGFSESSIRVIDLTEQDSPQTVDAEVAPQSGGFEATVAVPGSGRRLLLAISDKGVKKASAVVANRPSQLNRKNQRADLLIISHKDFISALGPLVELRQGEGLSVAVVDVEDIYDEFSYGAHTASAIKDFLSRAKGTWKKPPRFVMLVGDASLDPRDYLGRGDWDYVPTKLIDTTYMETASDDWFADFDGDGLGEMSVGRLPARTGQEAATMVAKIVGYEESEAGRGVLFVSDEKDQFDFEASSRQLGEMMPEGVKVQYVNRGGGPAAEIRRRLLEGISQGPKIVNYQGHGSIEQWKGDILTSSDARQMGNGKNLSMFIAMTCMNGYFQDPALEAIGETLIKSEKGGAVAVWASSGMTEPDKQAIMDREALRMMFASASGRGLRLGEITTRAKGAVNDAGFRLTWILLGDPSMRLR
jgi:CSLREA domain-containing protein